MITDITVKLYSELSFLNKKLFVDRYFSKRGDSLSLLLQNRSIALNI